MPFIAVIQPHQMKNALKEENLRAWQEQGTGMESSAAFKINLEKQLREEMILLNFAWLHFPPHSKLSFSLSQPIGPSSSVVLNLTGNFKRKTSILV